MVINSSNSSVLASLTNLNYLLLYLNERCVSLHLSVSVADLLSHSELDPDSDGSFTEAEAEVSIFILYHQYFIKKKTAVKV